MFVYTIQPFVKPVVKAVVKPVWQQVVLCIQTFNRLSNPFDNRFDKTAVSCKRGFTVGCCYVRGNYNAPVDCSHKPLVM